MANNTAVSDSLKKAYKLLSGGRNWIKNRAARDSKGYTVGPATPEACRYCLDGALISVCGGNDVYLYTCMQNAIRRALPSAWFGSYINYNDDLRCEWKHIEALLFKAIRMQVEFENDNKRYRT